MQHPLRRAPLLVAAFLFAALMVAPAANAAAVAPQLVSGNPDCASLGLTTITKFDPVTSTSATQAGITVTRTGSGTFDWSSTVAVDAVIVKGGNAANVYRYPYDFFADTNLVTPDNSSGGPAGISHIEFCTDKTTENPPANPAIHLEKTGAIHRGRRLHVHLRVRGEEHRRRDAHQRGAHRSEVRDAPRSASGPTSGDTTSTPATPGTSPAPRRRRRAPRRSRTRPRSARTTRRRAARP